MSAFVTTQATDIAGLIAVPERDLGCTEWAVMTQDEVDRFAHLTGDYYFLHVDEERARSTRFGGTIAHGLFSLSLLAPLTQRLKVSDASIEVNYGLDRLRFPMPLRVGDQWRARCKVIEATEIPGGVQATMRSTIEVAGSDKPAVVADFLIRFYE